MLQTHLLLVARISPLLTASPRDIDSVGDGRVGDDQGTGDQGAGTRWERHLQAQSQLGFSWEVTSQLSQEGWLGVGQGEFSMGQRCK